MKIETVAIRIPGLQREYTFYHTSDCHLAYALPEEGAEAAAKAEEQTRAWSYTGLLPADAMKQVLEIAQQDQADGVFLCGDVIDYRSKGTLKAAKDALSSTETPKFYVCGNHEHVGSMGDSPNFQQLMSGAPECWKVDFGDFLLLGMDDGTQQMSQEQLDWLKEQFAAGKPIVLLIHIPILTDAIIGPVKQKWGEGGPEYFLLGKPHDPELTRRFCQMLADPDAPIAAVFAGHIHLSHAGEIIPGRMQYVSGPAFEGLIRKVVLKAE